MCHVREDQTTVTIAYYQNLHTRLWLDLYKLEYHNLIQISYFTSFPQNQTLVTILTRVQGTFNTVRLDK